MDDLLREFVGESLDMMEAVASDLVAWEQNPSDRSGLDQIFRTIHTVKGSSSFFDLPRVTAIAHGAEELLDALRTRKCEPDHTLIASILAAFDRIRQLVNAIANDGAEPVGDDADVIALLLAGVHSSDRGDNQLSVLGGEDLMPLPEQVVGAIADGIATREVPAEWRSVRVPLELLDEVMNGASDLVLARNEVSAALRAEGLDPVNIAPFERLSDLLGSLRGSVSKMRMVPLRQMFAPLPRLVRQLSAELNKQVRLVTDGGEVEIDREVIEALRDPIIHVLRNAIDHGIEPPADRASIGKAATATIRISGRQVGNRIFICIEDDGAGLAEQGLIKRAIAAGHLTAERAARLSSDAINELVFLPGLSTAEAVTGISGRGVGMDVVKANVEKLGGAIRINSSAGAGVSIVFDVPMTLTIISALAIDIAGCEYAVPRSAVEEVLLMSSDSVQRVKSGGAQMVRVRGRLLPLVVIEDLLGIEPAKPSETDDTNDTNDRALVLCRLSGMVSIALEVPDIRDHAELVIKPLPPILLAAGLYNGFSLPDNGRPMLVLDVEGIARRANANCALEDALESQIADAIDDCQAADKWLCFQTIGSANISAVPMASIDRLVDLPASQIHRAGQRLVASIGETLIPIHDDGLIIPSGDSRIRMIILSDGARKMLLPVRNVLEITALKPEMLASVDDDMLIGLTMFDGDIVEMLDVYRLLGQAAGPISAGKLTPALPQRVIWIVEQNGSSWARSFLMPSLAAAGYAVQFTNSAAQVSDPDAIVIIPCDEAHQDVGDIGNVAMLELHRGNKVRTIAAYDRSSLIAALQDDADQNVVAAKPSPRKRKGA